MFLILKDIIWCKRNGFNKFCIPAKYNYLIPVFRLMGYKIKLRAGFPQNPGAIIELTR